MKIESLPDRIRSQLRDVSKALYGNRYRIEIVVHVAAQRSGTFYARPLALKLGLSDNVVGTELHKLEQAGLLRQVPSRDGGPRIFYERLPSCHWSNTTQLAEELVAGFGPRSLRSAS